MSAATLEDQIAEDRERETNGSGPVWGTFDPGVLGSEKNPRRVLWAPDLAKPLPPRVWASEWLTMARGRPTVFAGENGSRKGWFAMAIMLCGAADVPLLDDRKMKKGMRSLYLDFEQGQFETQLRFQALARGYDVPLASLGERLGYVWKPVPSLADPTSETIGAIAKLTEGIDLAVIDSWRASTPGVDENSVHASALGDLCLEVSERTGTTFVIIDHAGKPRDDTPAGRTRKHTHRGHSSKTDISQTLLVFSAKKGEATLVTCERSQVAAQEDWPKDFLFTLAGANGGLCLTTVAPPEPTAKDADGELADLAEAFVRVVRDRPGSSFDAVRSKLRKRAADVRAARDELLLDGRIVNLGTKSEPKWHVVGPTEEANHGENA